MNLFKKFDDLMKDAQNILRGSILTDWNPGSILRTLMEAWAALMEEAYFWLEWLLSMFFVSTAEGKWLDMRVADLGMIRIQGDRSAGILILGRDSPSPISVMIPRGAEFEKDGLVFATLAEMQLLEGQIQVEVPVQATQTGDAFNLLPGTELKQVGMAISSIEWVRVKELRGGLNTESDEEMRDRLPEYFASLSRATRPAIEFALNSISGVRAVALRPNDPEKGWFTVYLDRIDTPEIQRAVAKVLEEWRGFTIHYRLAEAVILEEKIKLKIIPEEQEMLDEVKALVKQAVEAHFTSLRMGDPLLVASLYQVAMNTKGVANTQVLLPLVDIQPAESEFVRPSEVIIE